MGYFSFITCDSRKSIPNINSCREVFAVSLIAPDGRRWRENAYEGYGVFGGKDIYQLVAELNNKDSRIDGINICCNQNSRGSFNKAAELGYLMPKLVEDENIDFDSVPYPEECQFQGFFYPERREEY